MNARGLNLLVFREGRRMVSGEALKAALFRQLACLPLTGLPETSSNDAALNALLRVGELECAAIDGGSPPCLFQALTDLLAEALLADPGVNHLSTSEKYRELKASLREMSLPETLSVSTPEGFAYYGLHPLAFADILEKLTPFPQRVAIIGIRTIGATISAVC